MGKMEIRRLTPAIGAEICDLDLSKPLSNAQWRDVHDAFLSHHRHWNCHRHQLFWWKRWKN